jgi:hypothetical protein
MRGGRLSQCGRQLQQFHMSEYWERSHLGYYDVRRRCFEPLLEKGKETRAK